MAHKSHVTAFRSFIVAGCASVALAGAAAAQDARTLHFDIPAEDLGTALNQVAEASGQELVFNPDLVRGKRVDGLRGDFTAQQALTRLLAGTGMSARTDPNGSIVIGPAGAGEAAPATVQEVVVTAQKREQKELEVPAPVSALQTNELMRSQAFRLQDYFYKAPGLNALPAATGAVQVVIRGVSTGANAPATTGYYIDDTPFMQSASYTVQVPPDIDPASLQRVEILRGPQGTLYGASALGGLVKFVTVQPNLETFSGRIEADGSKVSDGGTGWGARVLVNGPIVQDKLAFTLSAFDRRDAGYVDNPLLGENNVNRINAWGGRAALLFKPSDEVSIKLSALSQNSEQLAPSQVDLNPGRSYTFGGPIQQRYVDIPVNTSNRLYSATVNYDPPWGHLVSITSYGTETFFENTDYTVAFAPFIAAVMHVSPVDLGIEYTVPVRENKFTQELRLSSNTGQTLEWQAGLFFTHENFSRAGVLNAFNTLTGQIENIGDLGHFPGSARYTEYAGFGDLTWHLTPRFEVTGGLRYSTNTQSYTQPLSGLLAGNITKTGTSRDHDLTFLFAPKFKLNDDSMVYARIASGYRPGGPNDLTTQQIAAGVPATFKPDTVVNYEAGYKAQLFDHRATLEISAFDIEWKSIQLGEIIANVYTTGNAGGARSLGFEANGAWTPVNGLVLSANATYSDAYLTTEAPGIGGHRGDRLPEVPLWAANLDADYDFPLGDSLGGFVGGSLHYQGSRAAEFGLATSPTDPSRPVIPAYTTLDLRAGLSHGGWQLEAYLKNVTNKRAFLEFGPAYAAGSAFNGTLLQPRTVGISISDRF